MAGILFPDPSRSVFISHIHEEKGVANALNEILDEQLGLSGYVFLTSGTGQVRAGEVWLDRIKEELNTAKVLIAMLSHISIQRPWINFEAGAAWLAGKPIIPVCFGE